MSDVTDGFRKACGLHVTVLLYEKVGGACPLACNDILNQLYMAYWKSGLTESWHNVDSSFVFGQSHFTWQVLSTWLKSWVTLHRYIVLLQGVAFWCIRGILSHEFMSLTVMLRVICGIPGVKHDAFILILYIMTSVPLNDGICWHDVESMSVRLPSPLEFSKNCRQSEIEQYGTAIY